MDDPSATPAPFQANPLSAKPPLVRSTSVYDRVMKGRSLIFTVFAPNGDTVCRHEVL